MSNLSELLPAGAGAKSADFVASGTLGSGVTVALKADGTVEAVASDGTPQETGTPVTYYNEGGSGPRWGGSAYDSTNNRVIIAFRDEGGTNDSYGIAVVGTVSGTSISFGSPVIFSSSSTFNVSVAFDSSSNKVVIAYEDAGNNEYGTAVVGTVSGTSISFGTAVFFESARVDFVSITFDSNLNKVVIAYGDKGNSGYGTAIVGTVSGTSISFGSAVVFAALSADAISTAFDSNSNKVVISYRNNNTLYGTAIVGTVSGTSISFGTPVTFEAANTEKTNTIFDSSSNKVVISYNDEGNSSYGTAIVGTVSGTSISFGTPAVFLSATPFYHSSSFDSSANKVVISYRDAGNSNYGTYITGTVSGTSISFGAATVFDASTSNHITSTYDSTNKKVVTSYTVGSIGKAVVLQNEASNSADFIGITDQAIANTATGAVIVQGGVITNSELIDFVFNFGSDAIFESATIFYGGSTYDSTNNRVVRTYRDNGNSAYGTAVVGSVSGTTITWGTPVVFESAATNESDIAFDSANGKVVICYEDGGNSSYGTAIVGTVSGTSISFGSAAVFESAEVRVPVITYDANAQKVVIAYNDDGNSNYGTAIVGTVSGTSISFGSAVVFNAASTSNMGMAYDANAQKVVIAYQDGSSGNAVVGTISGTSISFGTEVTFESGTAGDVSAIYDPDTQKVVVSYVDEGDSNKGKAVLGTVSGTAISFGTAVTFADHATIMTENNAVAYDTTTDRVVINYENTDTNQNTTIYGTVSGTSISFGAAQAVGSGDTSYQTVVYDSNADSVVYMYRDNGNSDYGTGKAATLSKNLTIGTDYYVQDDGSLSTTVSSVPAGRALSATSILLEG